MLCSTGLASTDSVPLLLTHCDGLVTLAGEADSCGNTSQCWQWQHTNTRVMYESIILTTRPAYLGLSKLTSM